MMMLSMPRFNLLCTSLQFGWLLMHSTLQLDMHFCSSILSVCHFYHGVVRKVIKIFTFVCINTWQGTKRHYKRNIQLEHIRYFLKDFQKWHQILFHLHQHNYVAHEQYSCKGVCSSNVCISPQHFCNPISLKPL